MTIMGSGWSALAWEPVAQRLVTTQIYDHQSNVTQGGIPILVLDAWEHAFYLQYGPDKKSFFDAVWNLWNWVDVGQRFEKVRTLDLSVARRDRSLKVDQVPARDHSPALNQETT